MSTLKVADIRELMARFASEPVADDAKGRTRARILQAATERFSAQGYRKTSVDEVARDASVAKGTIYVHFPTKAELLMHAIAEEKRRFVSELAPNLAEGVEPTDRLRRHLAAVFRVLGTMPLLSRLVGGDREILVALDELAPGARDTLMQMQMQVVHALLEDLPRPGGWSDELLRQRGAMMIAVFYAAPQLMDDRTRPFLSREELADHLARVLVAGVVAP